MAQGVLDANILNDLNAFNAEVEFKGIDAKIVVLDDDPTGVQTVNNVSVFTDWEKPVSYTHLDVYKRQL